jgi:ORF6N domain
MKKQETKLSIIPNERIIKRIFWLRGEKVMLDSDLAELYEVEVRILNQAVRRNRTRFPKDFMFQLTAQEYMNLKSQIVISSWGGRRKLPYAFTEPGVAMLSSVLKSKRAIAVNVQIIRTFIQLRKMLVTYEALRRKIETMERKYDKRFKVVFDVLKKLLVDDEKTESVKAIGFHEKKYISKN